MPSASSRQDSQRSASEGRERQDQLLALVRAHGGRLIGPNCLGIAVSAPQLNATFGPRALPPGHGRRSPPRAARSGWRCWRRLSNAGIGLSAFVSIGNKADVSSNDLLEYWEDDPETGLVALYLESFGNPRRFGRIARRVARKKPILAMKSGTTTTGARAASSHTAALAGSEAAVDALFHQAGVIRARTLEELIDAAALFSSQPLPAGNRVAVLTNAGGLGILCADACEAAGLELPALTPKTESALRDAASGGGEPRQPRGHARLAPLGTSTSARFRSSWPTRASTLRSCLFVPPVVAGVDEVATAVARVVGGGADKPVLASLIAAAEVPATPGVTNFAYPESAARALGLAAARAEWLRRPAGSVPALDGVDTARGRALVDCRRSQPVTTSGSTPTQVRELLEAYGIPVVAERIAATPDDAAAAAAELGFPAVVKTRGARERTRPRRAASRSDLADEGDVRDAAARIGAPVDRPADARRGAPSSSPASSRTRSSARSSPSAQAACSPSSSVRPSSASRR